MWYWFSNPTAKNTNICVKYVISIKLKTKSGCSKIYDYLDKIANLKFLDGGGFDSYGEKYQFLCLLAYQNSTKPTVK